MGKSVGENICYYRQFKKMTQDELASRIGVTPQAVSKWERDNGLPDVNLLAGIATVLDVSADKLLGIDIPVADGGDILAADIQKCLNAEPLQLEFGVGIIPIVVEGLKTDYVSRKRQELAMDAGMLLPMLRLRDNTDLEDNGYQVMIYGKKMLQGKLCRCSEQKSGKNHGG